MQQVLPVESPKTIKVDTKTLSHYFKKKSTKLGSNRDPRPSGRTPSSGHSDEILYHKTSDRNTDPGLLDMTYYLPLHVRSHDQPLLSYHY